MGLIWLSSDASINECYTYTFRDLCSIIGDDGDILSFVGVVRF